jgi:hypothetical protein
LANRLTTEYFDMVDGPHSMQCSTFITWSISSSCVEAVWLSKSDPHDLGQNPTLDGVSEGPGMQGERLERRCFRMIVVEEPGESAYVYNSFQFGFWAESRIVSLTLSCSHFSTERIPRSPHVQRGISNLEMLLQSS